MDSTIRVPGKQAIKENYEKYRKLFSAIMDNIQKKISKDISLNPKPVYKSRIKSFDSYYSKLLRLKPKEASENDALVCLTDMMGIRIVCAFLEDISTVEKNMQLKKWNIKVIFRM